MTVSTAIAPQKSQNRSVVIVLAINVECIIHTIVRGLRQYQLDNCGDWEAKDE